MHRALIPNLDRQAATLHIEDADTLHHLSRVLRAREGEAVECLNGRGMRVSGTLSTVSNKAITISVQKSGIENPPVLKIILAQALIKPDPFEWMLQKATELGVSAIVPLISERTLIRGKAETSSQNRLMRWQRIIESAALQCGNAWLPQLAAPHGFAEAIKAAKGPNKFIFAAERDAKSIAMPDVLRSLNPAEGVHVFIGPEGDFSPVEVALARQEAFQTVWLGKNILRAETASIAAIVMLQSAGGGIFSGV